MPESAMMRVVWGGKSYVVHSRLRVSKHSTRPATPQALANWSINPDATPTSPPPGSMPSLAIRVPPDPGAWLDHPAGMLPAHPGRGHSWSLFHLRSVQLPDALPGRWPPVRQPPGCNPHVLPSGSPVPVHASPLWEIVQILPQIWRLNLCPFSQPVHHPSSKILVRLCAAQAAPVTG